MTEFKIGDIVRLTKGEPDKPGHEIWVREVTSGDLSTGRISSSALRAFEDVGWTVELIERPAPPLPTKPNTLGWATVDGTRYLTRLANGVWELYDEDGRLGSAAHPSTIEDFTEAVLIPKTLANKVMGWADDKVVDWRVGGLLERIANHLKGQDDE